MKTITIYELLGMVKDGKELPKKIKVHNTEYHKCLLNTGVDYKIYSDDVYYLSNEICKAGFSLNDEVEIIEEEKKIPEKLDVIAYERCIHEVTHKEKELALEIRETQIAFNEIIDYLKSKGE